MVRLIGVDGAQLGVLTREEAMLKAQEAGLDLVEVAPTADPPVCRLMDYGKFKYQQRKKFHQHHHRPVMKEVRIGMMTDDHDLDVKSRRARDFLAKHDKVLISMRLRGRQKAHTDIGVEVMLGFAARLEDVAKVERPPGRDATGKISMLLAPK